MTNTAIENKPKGLPIPFSREQLREDILRLYLLQARTTALVVPADVPWPLVGPQRMEQPGGLWNIDLTPQDLGLTYETIRETQLARALEQQYDFGFLGLRSSGNEPMEYESSHMWIAAYLMDLKGSQLVSEWDSYGVDLEDSVARCLHTCELANARLTLEGEESFSYFATLDGQAKKSRKGNSETATSLDGLTIRQMALLAGMEEMTIRTAASRQGPNMLATFKDDQRRTLVKPEEARKWLIAKGRYVAITNQSDVVDLTKLRFGSTREFTEFVHKRMHQLAGTGRSPIDIADVIRQRASSRGHHMTDQLLQPMLMDAGFMEEIGQLLELPPELLALRARQSALQEEVGDLEQRIRQSSAALAQI
jgi:hypothetical protein